MWCHELFPTFCHISVRLKGEVNSGVDTQEKRRKTIEMAPIILTYFLLLITSRIASVLSLQLAPGSQFTPFLQTCLLHLNLAHPLVPLEMDPTFASCVGKVGKVEVQFRAAAFTSPLLRYMRMISFTGSGYDVFNLVAIPQRGISLPILGIDIVSLPRTFHSSLISLLFHPLTPSTLRL